MNWGMFITLALVLAWIRWDKNQWNLGAYVRDILLLFVYVYLYTIIVMYSTNKFHLSISKYIRDILPMWFSGITFLLIICGFSIKGWRKIKREKDTLDSAGK